MGGNVGMIIRKENGEQIAMSRWTNLMPHWFKDIRLYRGQTQQWYDDFSKEWLLMKNDYEQHKDSKNYALPMTSVYFPHVTASPDEYGIIVVDFQHKKIYSSQDYCNIGSLSFYHMWSRRQDEQDIEALQQYYEQDMLKSIQYYCSENQKTLTLDISSLSFMDVVQLLKESADSRIEHFSHPLLATLNKEDFNFYDTCFIINSEWSFVTYYDRSQGILKIKQSLDQDGFIFTPEDNAAWKKYLSHHWEIHDDDDLNNKPEYIKFTDLYQEVFHEPYVLPPTI